MGWGTFIAGRLLRSPRGKPTRDYQATADFLNNIVNEKINKQEENKNAKSKIRTGIFYTGPTWARVLLWLLFPFVPFILELLSRWKSTKPNKGA
jgi:hypothetical protein